MIKKRLPKVVLLLLVLAMLVNTAAATCNIIIITDPTGKDPNGAAAGSLSFAENMFQSTFIMSKEKHFSVLSGGEGNQTPRLGAIVETIKRLENDESAPNAASAASNFPGIRIMCGGPTIGAAVGGSFDVYVVTVDDDDGTITATPASGGLATLPPGQKGAIIHLRNTHGNPLYGSATTVRRETAIMIGKMIRDGYPATEILGASFEKVSKNAGEKYGGGGNNLVSSLTTGDMFTPSKLNTTGYPMDEAYSKTCPECGWSVSLPSGENYQTCPYDGTALKTIYAYELMANSITVTKNNTNVYIYGTDNAGISGTTKEIVQYSVKQNGYNTATIASAINKAIDNSYLLGVNYIEPKDINIVESTRSVGVYYNPLPNHRSSPAWNLPISSSILDIVGSIQTAIGLILIVLVLFRSTLFSSFTKKRR